MGKDLQYEIKRKMLTFLELDGKFFDKNDINDPQEEGYDGNKRSFCPLTYF